MSKKNTNLVCISGNLTKEPDLKYTEAGAAYVNLCVAVNDTFKIAGISKTSVEFFNVIAWDKLAENIAAYLHKGSKVFVHGKLQSNSWEKDGHNFKIWKVVVKEIEFLGHAQKKD